jgi:tryptophanyl-tRNA synthetase
MSLQDPTRKMSKSDDNQGATLFILDTPDQLRKKIMSAVTDSSSEIRAAEDKPGVSNLLQIHSALSGDSLADLEAHFTGKGLRRPQERKSPKVVVTALEPVRTRYEALIADKAYLESVLRDGAAAAQKHAYRMLAKVYRKAGFVERPR